MRKLYITITLILLVLQSQAQFDTNAPWMKSLKEKSSKKEFTLAEISNAFNTYWEIHKEDKDRKGSGYKPFKRWEYRWKSTLDSNGMIVKPNAVWNAWREKNKLQSRRNTTDFSNWQNTGPFTQESKSGQGRINVVAVDPSNSDVIYIGAPAGGIWKSTSAGTTWEPLSDNLPQIGVSGIAIDPNNSDIIYIATGDDDHVSSYSIGVLKSIDGGTTWNTTGLQFTNDYSKSNEIYLHPNNSAVLWVATSDGLFKTTDAGTTWNNTQSGNVTDLKLHPTNPNIIYIIRNNRFYKSTNEGDSFFEITTGLPSFSSRAIIDVTPANPDLVYFLSANSGFQGLYKSNNSGTSFNQTSETSDIFGGSQQAWYDLALSVSDTNEDIVFVGVLDIWKSTDGGNDFTQINHWYDSTTPTFTHADIHFLRYFNGALFCGSDGGIYKSTNDGVSFNELNEGLSISQYYTIAVSKQSANNIAGGLQDNGGFGYSNDTWYKYHGGDGMESIIDPNNQNRYYGFSQNGGSLNVTHNGGVTGQGVVGAPEDGNWVTPLEINAQSEIYAGYGHFYKLNKAAASWEQVSNDTFGGNIEHIEIDPSNNDIIYVSNNNTLYKSTDRGVNFNAIYFANDGISSIEVNNENSSLVYLTIIGWSTSQVLKSTDGGTNFNNITGNLPSETKNVIKHQPHSNINDLYVGTDLGVYHINDTMSNWEVFSNNLPNVPVRDIDINIVDKKITIGTYGRGVWQSDIEVIPPSDDVRIVRIINPNKNYSCDTNISPEISIVNEGQNSISQVFVNYFIDDTNYTYTFNGTIAPSTNETITLPSISGLTLGEHQIAVETTIANDTYEDNNNSLTTFYINDFDNSPTTINSFNSNADKWLVTNSNLWEIGNPTTILLSASGSRGYTTNPSGNYPNNTTSYLVSPCYNLSLIDNPVIKFDMAFDLEIDYDVLYVEYTTNQGVDWNVLGDATYPNWYNSDFSANQLTIGKQWTGTDSTFKEYSYYLAALTNETNISFRFSFLSDAGLNQEGVIIDNFVIADDETASINNEFINDVLLYPNPSNGTVHITRKKSESMQLTVVDITGKIIKKVGNIISNEYQLNLLEVEKGVYFIKITINDQNTTKKIILK